MKPKNLPKMILRMRKRAQQTRAYTNYAVVAVGLNRYAQFLDIATPIPRFWGALSNEHAEEVLIRKCNPKELKTIVLARFGAKGNFLPIEPCDRCLELCHKKKIAIISLLPEQTLDSEFQMMGALKKI